MDPEVIKSGIFTRLMGSINDFKTAIGSELYFGSNPKETNDIVYPYAVFFFRGGALSRSTADRYENPILTFTLYDDADTTTRIIALAVKLDARLNGSEASVTMTGLKVRQIERISTLGNVITNDLEHWQLPIDYKIQLQS